MTPENRVTEGLTAEGVANEEEARYEPSPLFMSMKEMNSKNGRKKRRTSGQKILMFCVGAVAVVIGFVLMAANSDRTIRERQAGEQNRKPLISDPTVLENDLLAAAEALKYRPVRQEPPKEEPAPTPENRIFVVKPSTATRKAEFRLPTDEEREAARRYRDMKGSALTSKSKVEGFQEANGKEHIGQRQDPLSQEQILTALSGANKGGSSAEAIQAALLQENMDARDVNAYRHKLDFLTQDGAARTPQGYSSGTRKGPLVPMELKAGTVVPGLLVTGINSDLPGTVIGQVSENVWDTAAGNFLLIPQGTRVIGVYDSKITRGQKRVSVVWNRLIYPDGSALDIAGSPGTDLAGYGGIKGRVDNHYGQLLTAALFTSVFSGLADIAGGGTHDSDKKSAKDVLVETAGVTIANVGARLAERALEVQPTIVVKPGTRFNVMVQRDIVFLQTWKTIR